MSEGNGDTARGMLLASINRLDLATRDLWNEVNLLRRESADGRQTAALQATAIAALPCEQHRQQLKDLHDGQVVIQQTIRDRLSWRSLLGKLSATLIPLLMAGLLLAEKVKSWIGIQP